MRLYCPLQITKETKPSKEQPLFLSSNESFREIPLKNSKTKLQVLLESQIYLLKTKGETKQKTFV
jgi:hypothetical protein